MPEAGAAGEAGVLGAGEKVCGAGGGGSAQCRQSFDAWFSGAEGCYRAARRALCAVEESRALAGSSFRSHFKVKARGGVFLKNQLCGFVYQAL